MAAKGKLPRTRRSKYILYSHVKADSSTSNSIESTPTRLPRELPNIVIQSDACSKRNGCSGQKNTRTCDEEEELQGGVAEDSVDMATRRPMAQLNGTSPILAHRLEHKRSSSGIDEIDRASPVSQRTLSIKRSSSKRKRSRADSPDFVPYALPFTWFDIVIYFLSIGSYIVDVGSDLWVAYLYYSEGKWWWFGLTLAFVIVPSVVTTIFSLTWYIQDHYYHKKISGESSVGKCKWASRLVFHALQLGPVLRYFDTMWYGLKSRKLDAKLHSKQKRHWYELMLYEDTDSALLRLFECFMEAAPQLTLQLYIMCRYGPQGETTIIVVGQGIACATSLASLSFALTSYHRALRFSLDDKANLGYLGMFFQFVWRFFTIGARVLAMALFATQFTYWVFVLVGCHWVVMIIWVLWQRTHFCDTRCQEFIFNVVSATIYIFCYLNLIEGHTRLRYLFYYVLVYAENLFMILGWWFYAHTESKWYINPAIALVCAGFFIGIGFQVLYYSMFHPNNYPPHRERKGIKWCLTWREMCNQPPRKPNYLAPHHPVHGSGDALELDDTDHQHGHHHGSELHGGAVGLMGGADKHWIQEKGDNVGGGGGGMAAIAV